MNKKNINYKSLIDLGFKREDYHDNVEFNETGHHPFHLSLKMSKGILENWELDSGNVEILRIDKDHNILGKVVMDDLSELRSWVKFFGKEASSEK